VVVAEGLVVAFSGEGSGTADLSWGQQTVWRGIEARGTPIWLTGVEQFRDGTTMDDVAATMSFLMSRHQSLRTRLRRGDDGRMQQFLVSSGTAWLEIVDADDEADPYVFARELEATFDKADLDYAQGWPLRMAAVRHRGVPVYRVVAMCHTTSDGFGVLALLADLAARDPLTGAASGPVTAMQALEQARVQAGPTGQRQSRSAERHWERVLHAIPPRRFPESRDRRQPRWWEVTYDSPAAYLAMQAVAARTGVDTSPVLLAAFAVALARTTGVSLAVPRVQVNNRFRPRFADTVSPIAQTCPCVIDVAGISFDEAVTRAYRASMAAYKNAYFEPARIRALVAAAGHDRGEDIDVDLVYNDRRLDVPREAASSLPDPQELRAALPRTTLSWTDQSDEPTDSCHIHIRDSADSITVLVGFDTHYVSPADLEAVLRGVESALVEAAFDGSVPVGL
jgi:Condensation domain